MTRNAKDNGDRCDLEAVEIIRTEMKKDGQSFA